MIPALSLVTTKVFVKAAPDSSSQLQRTSSPDPALSMVSIIDIVTSMSGNSSLAAESVACEMCLSKADRASRIDIIVDSSAWSIMRNICGRCETFILARKHCLFCRQCLR